MDHKTERDADQHDAARRQSASWLTDQDLEEFMKAYKEAYGEKLSTAEAREMATRVIELYKLLAKPLPKEKKEGFELPPL